MSLCTRQVTITNKLGLHARAASKLVNTASAFEAQIKLRRDEREADAKSIMSVMMLAASKGVELEVVAEGADADIATPRRLRAGGALDSKKAIADVGALRRKYFQPADKEFLNLVVSTANRSGRSHHFWAYPHTIHIP